MEVRTHFFRQCSAEHIHLVAVQLIAARGFCIEMIVPGSAVEQFSGFSDLDSFEDGFSHTTDLLRKDSSAAISRFRRRGDSAVTEYASRLSYDFAKIIHHIPRICFIIFATLARNLTISLRKL